MEPIASPSDWIVLAWLEGYDPRIKVRVNRRDDGTPLCDFWLTPDEAKNLAGTLLKLAEPENDGGTPNLVSL